MRKLRYSSAALNDLAEIAAYIAEASQDRTVADRFVGRLMDQCEKLAALPGTLGRPRRELLPDIRSFAYGNYVIFFRYLDAEIEIVDVLEGHRDIIAHFRDDEFQ